VHVIINIIVFYAIALLVLFYIFLSVNLYAVICSGILSFPFFLYLCIRVTSFSMSSHPFFKLMGFFHRLGNNLQFKEDPVDNIIVNYLDSNERVVIAVTLWARVCEMLGLNLAGTPAILTEIFVTSIRSLKASYGIVFRADQERFCANILQIIIHQSCCTFDALL
jgi:hypothetical protein